MSFLYEEFDPSTTCVIKIARGSCYESGHAIQRWERWSHQRRQLQLLPLLGTYAQERLWKGVLSNLYNEWPTGVRSAEESSLVSEITKISRELKSSLKEETYLVEIILEKNGFGYGGWKTWFCIKFFSS